MAESSEHRAKTVLLADVGGTNARFAVLSDGGQSPVAYMEVRDYRHFTDALARFLERSPNRATVRNAVLAVAGVVKNERCELTNSPWVIDAAELRAHFGLSAVHLVNDFEAIAWSLPHLAADDLARIGGSGAVSQAPMVVLGPGTGLGVAGYIPGAQGGFVLPGEGGHSTMPSGSEREDAIIVHLRERFGHVSAERVISGAGLENLYRTVASLDAVAVPERTAAEISQAAMQGQCATCRSALDTFCAMLGDVAGNFALSFGALGGVYIAGGIIPRIRDHLSRTQFRERFEAKGRMRAYLEPIPVYLILRDDPAFIGLRALAARRIGHERR